MRVEEITSEFAEVVIEKREPLGLFVVEAGDRFIGIDNSVGEAFVEEFKDKETCVYWLENSSVEYYTGNDFGKTIKELEKEAALETSIQQIDEIEQREFDVVVTEKLVKLVTVIAKSEDEALEKVGDRYDNEGIVLDYDDFDDVEIRIDK